MRNSDSYHCEECLFLEATTPTRVLSHFGVEGDSFLLSVRTVGIMFPLSEVKRPLETGG